MDWSPSNNRQPCSLWGAFRSHQSLIPSSQVVSSSSRQLHSRKSTATDTSTHNGQVTLNSQCKPQRSRPRGLLSRLLPSWPWMVHAAEPSDRDANQDTTIDRLGQSKPSILVSDEEVHAYLQTESGRDRVRELFTRNDDTLHPDMNMLTQSVILCSSGIFLVTSVFGSRLAREAFLERTKHHKFETKFLYARAYNDAIILGGMKFGMKWAFKTGVFSVIYLLTAQTIATYRNRSSVWEYVAGGAVTGSLLRFSMGPKGMFAGGVIGGTIGLIGGGCIYLLLRASNETQEQKHYWRVHEEILRRRQIEHDLGVGKYALLSETDVGNNQTLVS